MEKYLKKQVEKKSGLCLKFTSPGTIGVPDRIVLFNKKVFFVELKKPGETLRPSQEMLHKKFLKHGINVQVIDTKDRVDQFVAELEAGVVK